MRPAILAAAAVKYVPPELTGPFRLLVVGGSQGARVMADIVPGAIERLEPALWNRLVLTQQVREEDMARVRAVYDRLKINAELAPFFSDLPARLASNHLVVSRSGAGTVAELAAIGRPSILVPLPGSIDQDQFANAGVLAQASGALRIPQGEFTSDRLAAEISALAAEPARLTAMAANARTVGRLDAAERLADLVMKVAGNLGLRDRIFGILASWPGLSRPSTSIKPQHKQDVGCPGQARPLTETDNRDEAARAWLVAWFSGARDPVEDGAEIAVQGDREVAARLALV